MMEKANICSETLIALTPAAVEAVRELQAQEPGAEGKGLRLSVSSGGCSGKQYTMAFDDRQPNDIVNETGGIAILADPASAEFLAGTQIDYSDTLNGGGFKVSIPKARQTCGCGKSFEA